MHKIGESNTREQIVSNPELGNTIVSYAQETRTKNSNDRKKSFLINNWFEAQSVSVVEAGQWWINA